MDVALTHETKVATRALMLSWARDLIQSDQPIILGEDGSFEYEPSPAVANVIKSKNNRYSLLSHIANIQKASGKRPDKVVFVACVMSHAGEMAPEFISLVEKLSHRMRPIHSRPDCLSGLSPNQATHDFRRTPSLLEWPKDREGNYDVLVLVIGRIELLVGVGFNLI